MRISIIDRSAVGLVICKTEERILTLLTRLSKSRTSLQNNPLALLNVVADEYGKSCETARKFADDEVVSIETSTGMTSLQVQPPKKAQRDIAELNKASHAANTNLIFLDNVINFDVVLGKFIKEIFVKLETLRQRRNLEPIPVSASQVLHDNIDFLITLSALRRQQAKSLHQRVQSQISVVSKINQVGQVLLHSTQLIWFENIVVIQHDFSTGQQHQPIGSRRLQKNCSSCKTRQLCDENRLNADPHFPPRHFCSGTLPRSPYGVITAKRF